MNEFLHLSHRSTNTWRLDDVFDGKAWRYFRVQMSGKNSEKESCLCLSGFELYGRVTGVCNEIGMSLTSCCDFFEMVYWLTGKASKNKPVRRIRHETRSSENSLETRPRVRRGEYLVSDGPMVGYSRSLILSWQRDWGGVPISSIFFFYPSTDFYLSWGVVLLDHLPEELHSNGKKLPWE